MAKRTREEVLAALEVAETEEGRTGLVAAFLAENPDPVTKDPKSKKSK